MEEYRLSQFVHRIEVGNGLVALYNALSLGVVFLESDVVAELLLNGADTKSSRIRLPASANGLTNVLLANKIIIPAASINDEDDLCQVRDTLGCGGISILYLLLTSACNLACKYCFESGRRFKLKEPAMSLQTVEFGLQTFSRELRTNKNLKEAQIILYGGEPTLNFPALKYALESIQEMRINGELPESTSITLNTNGVLIDEELVAVLRNIDNLNIAISIDGPAFVHDTCRPVRGGEGSYEKAIAGYQLLRNNGIEAGLCCTISTYNVDRLPEIAEWFVDTIGVRSLGFNMMIENFNVDHTRGQWKEYAEKTAEALLQCLVFFRSKGVHEDRIMRKVNAFVDGTIYPYDCGGCGQQIVVAPDGQVGVCQAYLGTGRNFITPGADFSPPSHPLWQEWAKRSPLMMPQCKDCIALALCGGGCPYSADMRHGSIWELDDVFCVHAKKTVEFLIRDLAQQFQPAS